MSPGSACASCHTPIAWYDNVPILSYLLLGGRCRSCGARIGLIHPAFELVTAGLLAGCLAAFGLTLHAAAAAMFCAALVVVTGTDLTYRVVPTRVVLPSIVLVLALMTAEAEPGVGGRRAGASVAMLVVALAYPSGLGMGDVKLALLMGVALGRTVPIALLVGMIAALVPSLFLLPGTGQSSQDGDSLRAIPRARVGDRAVRRTRAPRRVSERLLRPPNEPGSPSCTTSRRWRRPSSEEVRDRQVDRPGGQRCAPGQRAVELVADLIASTGLVPADRLALARGRSARKAPSPRRSSPRASPPAKALPHARRAPPAAVVDLKLAGVRHEAEQIPVHVLRARLRSPTGSRNDMLHMAVADPGNVQAMDELRRRRVIASRWASPPRRDRRRARADRPRIRGGPRGAEESGTPGRSRTSRRRTGSPRARSSRSSTRSSSRPPRTARATSTSRRGARPRHPLPGRRPPHEIQRIPRRNQPGCDDTPQGAGEARHRRAPPAAGRPHLARAASRPAARHPRRDAPDGLRRDGRHAAPRQVEARCRRSSDSGFSDEMRARSTSSSPAATASMLVTGRPARGRRRRSTPPRTRSTARDQHHHRRGPGRVPARRASTRCRSTRSAGLTFATAPALDPAAGSRRDHGRRDPRQGDREDRDRGRAHGPPRAHDAAHQRRRPAR